MAAEIDTLHGMVPDTHDTALLLIDVINHLEFEGNEGWDHASGKKTLFASLELVQNVEEIGKNIASLKAAARKAGIPVVYVNDNFDKWKSDFRHVIEYVQQEDKPGKFHTPLASAHQIISSFLQGKILVDLLHPHDDDCKFDARRHSSVFAKSSMYSRFCP